MKKRFFAFIATLQIFLLFIPIFSVKAFLIGSPSGKIRKEIKKFLTNDLLIDSNNLGIGQNDRKTLVPQVKLTFTKVDETHYKATVQPVGITNPKEAYYTWYIRNKKNKRIRGFKPVGTLPLADQIGSAGADPDDPEFWKIMATREIIKYYFDPQRYDSTFNGGNGNFVLESGEYAKNTDNDGYKARVGGGDANDGPKYCYLYDRQDGGIYELASGGRTTSDITCPDGYTPTCVTDNRMTCPDPADGAKNILYDHCEQVDDPVCKSVLGHATPTCSEGMPICVKSDYEDSENCPMPGEELPKKCEDLSSDGILVDSITCDEDTVFRNDADKNIESACDEDKIHMFPFTKDDKFAGYHFTSGDGHFGSNEERFWGTDPENDTTVPDHLDEETIVGKGMASFIWEYHEGDEIGVVVEGTGNPTRHDDRSMQTVFAFLPGGCKPKDTGFYLENVRGKNIKIHTADMGRDDLNECLTQDDNFQSPGGQKEELKLDVKIIGPDKKVIPKNKDKYLTFDSVLGHKGADKDVKTQRHNTDFEWVIEHGFSQDGPFIPVTDRDFLRNQFGILNSSGIGVDSLKMIQNFPEDWFSKFTKLDEGRIKDKGWVKIILRVNAPSAREDVTRFGQTSFLFQISDAGNSQLQLSIAKPTDASAKSYTEEKAICRGPGESYDCDVLVNQVVRVALPSDAMTAKNTLWTVNGKSTFCNEFISSECKPNNHGVIYIPITKDVNTYNIKAVVSELGTIEKSNKVGDKSVLASTIEYDAVLNKVNPKLVLSAGGSASELERGTKHDIKKDVNVTEISHNLFLAPRGSSVTVKANFIPDFLNVGPEAHLEWYINSTPYSVGDVDSISFSSERDVTVKANGYYDISNDKRRALQNIFGIQADVSGRTFFDESAKVEMTDSAIAKAPSNKIFATISQNSPVYIMFLLKIIFIIGIILFIPYVILSLTKKN